MFFLLESSFRMVVTYDINLFCSNLMKIPSSATILYISGSCDDHFENATSVFVCSLERHTNEILHEIRSSKSQLSTNTIECFKDGQGLLREIDMMKLAYAHRRVLVCHPIQRVGSYKHCNRSAC